MLPVNTYPFPYETASLANILFVAALKNNDINKVSALAIKVLFKRKSLIHYFK